MRTIVAKNRKIDKRHYFYLSVGLLLLISHCLSACAPNTGLLAGGDWQLSGLQHQHIRVLEVGFNNTQLLYAGDTQQGVFASTDSGLHWRQQSAGLPLPIGVDALSFDTTGKKLYAATDKGIFVSDAAARHWQAVGTGLPADTYTTLAFDANAAPHTIYVGTTRHGVLVSANDGATWSPGGSGFPTNDAVNGLTFDPVQHQLWAATALGIYRSDERGDGTYWQAFNAGLPTSTIAYTIQVAFLSGGEQGLLFAGTNHGFFRSQGAGVHWTSSEESLLGTSVRAILIDFRSPTTIYVATNIGALRSDDSGQYWQGIGPGLPRDRPVYALELGASNYSQLYAAADDVYLFPGTSGGIGFTHLVPIALVLIFFYLLYRMTLRGRSRRGETLKPERSSEPPAPPSSQRDGNDPSRLHDLM